MTGVRLPSSTYCKFWSQNILNQLNSTEMNSAAKSIDRFHLPSEICIFSFDFHPLHSIPTNDPTTSSDQYVGVAKNPNEAKKKRKGKRKTNEKHSRKENPN